MCNQTKQELLRKLRKEAKINQADLANLIGICRETIISIEKGKPSSIDSMSLTNIVVWFNICAPLSSDKTVYEFKAYMKALFDL